MLKKVQKNAQKVKTLALMALIVTIPNLAFAQTAAKRAWPWRAFIQSLVDEFTGPLPLAIGTLGMVGVAISLFKGHGGEGTNKGILLVLAVSVALAAPTLLSWIATDANGILIGGM